MLIKTIEIKGLWGKFQIKWDLNPDVNILAGINGSGKSTLLNLIAGVLQKGHFIGNVEQLVNEVKIIFDSTQTIQFTWSQDVDLLAEKYQVSQNEILQMLFLDKLITETKNPSLLKRGLIKTEGFREQADANTIFPVVRVNTFDEPINTHFFTQEYRCEKIKTDLDQQLFELQIAYLSYQIELGKQVEQAFLASDNIDIKTKREEIYGKKDFFIQTINQFFAETGKTIAYDKGNKIVFRQNDKILTPYQLSAGEKQFLIISLSALIQGNEPYMLIMDEPEISLHVEWQEELIKIIRHLNNNVQIILATHSPSIVMNGWMDKITNMEDITSEENK